MADLFPAISIEVTYTLGMTIYQSFCKLTDIFGTSGLVESSILTFLEIDRI